MRTYRGDLSKDGQISPTSVQAAIGAFYRLHGATPQRVLVRPGMEAGTAATVKGLGLPAVKVEAGTRGILTGEIWME